MNLFKDKLSNSESLFQNELALDTEYIPKLLPFRESQQKYIASCINLLIQGKLGKNLIITGSPGIGKTALIKYMIKELQETSLDEQITPVYINCWKKDSSYKIALEICAQINYKFTHNKDTDQLLKETLKILNKKPVLLCFDEIDKSADYNFLYTLLEELYKKTLVLITNNVKLPSQLDERIRSRLVPELINFEPYTLDETKAILQQRIEYAFIPNAFKEDVLDLISLKTYSLKDIRYGLFMLRESGNIAESDSSRFITLAHAQSALEKINDFSSNLDLKDEHKIILELIKENSGQTTKDLFEIYRSKKGALSYSAFYKNIKQLESKNLLLTKELNKGHAGRALIVEAPKTKKLDEF